MNEPEHPVPRRRVLIVVSIVAAFMSGAAAGVLVTSAAASRAARVTVEGARGLFVYDQTARLALAWNAGDMSEALAHAMCAYEAQFAEGSRWFDHSAADFSVWGGAFLQVAVVEPNAPTAAEVRPMDEAVAHAKIAVVLERLGRTREAQDRLTQAAKVGGREPPRWREVALRTVGITLPQGFLHPDGVVRR